MFRCSRYISNPLMAKMIGYQLSVDYLTVLFPTTGSW